MVKINLRRGSVSKFEGDAIIVPSDVDLTYKRANRAVRAVLENGGSDLLRELSAVGYCEIGNALIAKGYDLNVKHVIFLPYTDQGGRENKLSFVLFHQALRSALNLAELYGVKTLAIDILPLRTNRKGLLGRLISKVVNHEPTKALPADEIIDIVTGISEEHKATLKEITIYK